MNKNLYRLVFSKKFGNLVAVAETTVSQGKSANGETGAGGAGEAGDVSVSGRSGYGLAAFSLSVATAVLGASSFVPLTGYAQVAGALPTGGVVTYGTGTINYGTGTNGNTLTVNQGSNVLGANWNSFSIGAGNTVIFNQPSSSSIAVNRVTGNDRSEIYGNLQANGQVFLLNPNGVFFSASSQVQVGALVASTKNITDAQLSAGDYTLNGNSQASIINQGNLKAVGDGTGKGYVVLAADQVKNDGTIEANGGKIVLAAGQTLGLTLSNGQLLSVQVTGSVINALVENKGLIIADGGNVFLTAKGKDALLNTVVNNTGIIRANSMVVANGTVTLGVVQMDGEGGDVVSTGSIDVSGTTAGGNSANKGGTVIVQGDRVGLFGNASINASGDAGGGRVIIGGDSLGKVADSGAVRLANQTVVSRGVNINVGTNSSLNSGTGGFVETSGRSLTMLGNVTGKGASWLIDPTDIDILDGTSSNIITGASPGSTSFSSIASAAQLSNVSVENALNSGTNVTITTAGGGSGTGWINHLGAITYTGNNNVSLTMLADGYIYIGGNNILATGSGQLNVNLTAGLGGDGYVNIYRSAIDTNGGALVLRGSSSGSPGVNIQYSSVRMGHGSTITGTSATVYGVSIQGSVGVNSNVTVTNGTATINGMGETIASRSGVWVDSVSQVNIANGASLNVTGTSDGGSTDHGIDWQGTLNNAGGTRLTGYRADTSTGYAGLSFTGAFNSTAGSSTTLTGNADGAVSGLVFNPSTLTNTQGNITLAGSSAGGAGVEIWGLYTLSVAAGDTLTIIGSSQGSHGVQIQDSGIDNAGTLNITGISSAAASGSWSGVYSNANHFNSTASSTTVISGTSSDYAGVYSNGDEWRLGGNTTIAGLTTAGSSGYYAVQIDSPILFDMSNAKNTVITGSGISSVGVYFGGVTSAVYGNLTISGSSQDLGGMTLLNGELTAQNGANVVLTGSSQVETGINMQAQTLRAGGGSHISVQGRSDGSENGVFIRASSDLSSDVGSNLTVTGNSISGTGLSSDGSTTFNHLLGNTTLSGSSDSGAGLDIRLGTVSIGTTGHLRIVGSSQQLEGVRLDDALTNTAITNAGNLSIAGYSDRSTGVYWQANPLAIAQSYTGTASSTLNISGTSGSSGVGVQLDGPNNLVVIGNIYIAGSSTSGHGVVLNSIGSIDVQNGANLTITGSSVSGNGLDTGGSVSSIGNSGNLSLHGYSTGGYGLQLNALTSLTNTASANMTLTGTSQTSGGIYLSDIDITFGANTLINSQSGSGTGLLLKTPLATGYVINAGSNVTMIGNGTDAGIDMQSIITNSGNLTMSGTGSSQFGVGFNGQVINSGNMNISGNSTDASGVYFYNSNLTTNSGSQTWITGNTGSLGFYGVYVGNAGGDNTFDGNVTLVGYGGGGGGGGGGGRGVLLGSVRNNAFLNITSNTEFYTDGKIIGSGDLAIHAYSIGETIMYGNIQQNNVTLQTTGNINLNYTNIDNNISGRLDASSQAGYINISSANLNIGNISAGTNLILNATGYGGAAGAIHSLTGNITVLGNTTLQALGNINVSGAQSDLRGWVSANTAGGSVQISAYNLTLANVSASAGANLSATAGNLLNAAGSRITAGQLVLSATGNVTSTGGVNVTGTSDLWAGGQLNMTGVNNLSGLVSAVSSGNSAGGSLTIESKQLLLGTITSGGFALLSATDNVTVNNRIAAQSNITLVAGAGSAAGTNLGAQVVVANGTAGIVQAGLGGAGTTLIYSGTPSSGAVNYNTAAYQNAVGATAANTRKAYNVTSTMGSGGVNASKALNVLYRVSPTLNVTVSDQTKAYDGNTSANGTQFVMTGGLLDGDSATVLKNLNVSYSQSAVGTGLTVAATGAVFNTSVAVGYGLGTVTNSVNSSITALPISANTSSPPDLPLILGANWDTPVEYRVNPLINRSPGSTAQAEAEGKKLPLSKDIFDAFGFVLGSDEFLPVQEGHLAKGLVTCLQTGVQFADTDMQTQLTGCLP